MKFFLFFFIVILRFSLCWASDADFEIRAEKFYVNFKSIADTGGGKIWPNYTPGEVLLFDIENSSSAYLLNNTNKKKFLNATSPWLIPNNVYNFCGSPFSLCPLYLGLPTNVNLLLYNLASFISPAETALGLKPDMLHLMTTLHEGFHLYAQFRGNTPATWFKPTWGLSGNARNLVEKLCYNLNDDVFLYLKKELETLIAAIEASDNNSLDQVKAALQVFFQTRKARQNLLAGTSIESDGLKYTCAEAENIMEWIEGSADYFSISSLEKAQVLSPSARLELLKKQVSSSPKIGAHYYRLGSMQLILLSRLDSVWIDSLTEMMGQSSPVLTDLLEKVTKSP